MQNVPRSNQKTVLISGAATGIGRATAMRLARDGFFVCLDYKNESSSKELKSLKKELDSISAKYLPIKADITLDTDVKKMVSLIKKERGALDALINNAAISKIQSIAKFQLDEWDEVLRTNLTSAALLTKECLPLLKKTKTPRIIFIGSMGFFKGSAGRLAYTVSKGGVLGLCRSLAHELAPKFLVNAIIPGYINTDMLHKFRVEPTDSQLKRILLKRYGEPEDVAGAVSFLCSKDASYITGQSIHINGGAYLS